MPPLLFNRGFSSSGSSLLSNSGMIKRIPFDKGVDGGDTDSVSSITKLSPPKSIGILK